MKILFCNKYNFPFSGTEVYLFELMDLMRARGHEVALFSMADPRGEPTPYDQYLVPNINFKAKARWWKRAALVGHAIYSTDARRRIRAMIKEFRPDVAHVRGIYHHLSPSILWELRRQGIPVLYHVNDFKILCPTYNFVADGRPCELCSRGAFHHAATKGCYNGPRSSAVVLAAEAYLHKWLRTYERCVDMFLAPSAFVRNKLTAAGLPGERIEVLPHFQTLPGDRELGTDEGYLLYFGRLSP